MVSAEKLGKDQVKRLGHGVAVELHGNLVASLGSGQDVEIQVESMKIHGECAGETYPIQPKRHSLDFLRENAHLRVRTQTFSSIFRVRSALALIIHDFFRRQGFHQVHTPVITKMDAEGAGEMFPLAPGNSGGHFFGSPAFLTVSGQLQAEALCLGLGKVYTFGPTFRAENSNTSRHLAEFWMVEPEMAFCDMQGAITVAEELLREVVAKALVECEEDIAVLDKYHAGEQKNVPEAQRSKTTLIEKLEAVARGEFVKVSYTDAVELLKEAKGIDEAPSWGVPLQTEHERFLAEHYFKAPVIVYDYPREAKAFYMRVNEDGQTVAAFDVLLPGIGEIIGGSQREDRIEHLHKQMDHFAIPRDALDWYVDTRQYGSALHSGFGLGFERLVQFVCGMTNIRDVIPFPRTPGNAPF